MIGMIFHSSEAFIFRILEDDISTLYVRCCKSLNREFRVYVLLLLTNVQLDLI